MSPAELDRLVRRANSAGHDTIADYAVALEHETARLAAGLRLIADAQSGVWRRMARDTLNGGKRDAA